MDNLVPLTEAKNRLHEIVRLAEDENVVILRHGRPCAVVISPPALQSLLDELEDLKDRISVLESRLDSEDMRVPIEKIKAELGHL